MLDFCHLHGITSCEAAVIQHNHQLKQMGSYMSLGSSTPHQAPASEAPSSCSPLVKEASHGVPPLPGHSRQCCCAHARSSHSALQKDSPHSFRQATCTGQAYCFTAAGRQGGLRAPRRCCRCADHLLQQAEHHAIGAATWIQPMTRPPLWQPPVLRPHGSGRCICCAPPSSRPWGASDPVT
jgi:hypothetical protein